MSRSCNRGIFNFLVTCKAIFQSGCNIYIFTSGKATPSSSTILPTLLWRVFFSFCSNFNSFIMIFLCGIHLYFTNILQCWVLFHLYIFYLYISFDEMSVVVFLVKCQVKTLTNFYWVVCFFIIKYWVFLLCVLYTLVTGKYDTYWGKNNQNWQIYED